MDVVEYRDDLRVSAGKMKWLKETPKWRAMDNTKEEMDGRDEEFVEVLLKMRAPWGFTLRGGLDHTQGQPLGITKAGDELAGVNGVSLGGSRQEAIGLVVHRQDDPALRPHSWHMSKLTEEESESWRRETTPKHIPRSKESSTQGDQSSVDDMERFERLPHPYNPGRLSPAGKYTGSPEQHCGVVTIRELSCLSGGSSPLCDRRPLVSTCKSTAMENIFFKGLQSESSRPGERLRYLQPPPGSRCWERARAREHTTPRVSSSSISSIRPSLWHEPETNLTKSRPSLRDDTFAISKVFPCSEGGQTVSQCRGGDRVNESVVLKTVKSNLPITSHHQKVAESRRGLNPTKDFLHPAADHNHNRLYPSKLFSLSSTDVRQSQAQYPPNHQRQCSDESPFYAQTRLVPPRTPQTMGSYYRSLQDIPADASRQKKAATGPAMTSSQTLESGTRKTRLPGQVAEPQVRTRKTASLMEDTDPSRRANGNGRSSFSSLKSSNKKYSLPQSKTHHIESNGHSQQGEYLGDELSSETLKRSEGHRNDSETKTHLSQTNHNDQKLKAPRSSVPWLPQEDDRISPLKTPLLHSLTQESWKKEAGSHGNSSISSVAAPASGKAGRRSDRYSTALRNEIQEKRAQLQKSRSAATLTHREEGDDPEAASAGSFSNTYKDHLKEAQARVLQATSFQRRDLEPPAGEVPAGKPGTITNNSNHHHHHHHHLSRIGARKRFPLAKRVRSFSEPDKMNQVGVGGEAKAGSPCERRRLFENTSTASRPPTETVPTSWRGGTMCGEPRENHPSPGSRSPSPGQTQALLEQERLGTFAEYQATWSMQRKGSDAKAAGRYRSAENIVDTDVRDKNVCVHERSRSSPSADFYAVNIPVPLRGPVNNPSMDQRYQQQSREQLERLYQPGQAAHSLASSDRTVPSDHRTATSAAASHATIPSGPPSHRPSSGWQHPAQAGQTEGLPPPPWSHVGHQTTSCTQEFDPSAQAGPASLQPSSGTGPGNVAPAQRCGASPGGTRPGAELLAAEASRQAMATERPQPSSPKTLARSQPSADRARPPSPQFAPQRLTDKPPAVSHHPARPKEVPREAAGVHSQARRVLVRIVHAESSSEREGRSGLAHNPQAPEVPEPPQPPEPPSLLLGPGTGAGLPSAPSPFSAYSAQGLSSPGARGVAEASSRSSEEDAKREELARDIMGRDKSLADILDQRGMKTTMDLMEGLFPQGEQVMEGAQQRRRAPSGLRQPCASPGTAEERSEDEGVSASASLVPSSSYYSTSAPKAELLIKMKDMQEQLEEQDSEDELDVDLAGKKRQLICSLARKLEVLREARQSLQEDVEANEALGRQVEATVQRRCRPNQLDKFRMFVGDLDKVVSLLLSLSGRLARVDNALNGLEDEAPPEEKRTLTEKRKLLMRQHEDAKELKENLDRRERLVSAVMQTHLEEESLDDYRHFVKMKSALIIEQRKLEDKVKLGEEQLKCLVDSLPAEQRAELQCSRC